MPRRPHEVCDTQELIFQGLPLTPYYSFLMSCLKNDFTHFVIPDLIEPAPYLIRGNPAFSIWVPAFAGMTALRLL